MLKIDIYTINWGHPPIIMILRVKHKKIEIQNPIIALDKGLILKPTGALVERKLLRGAFPESFLKCPLYRSFSVVSQSFLKFIGKAKSILSIV